MNRSKIFLQVVSLLYMTGCIIGFIYQVCLVSILYFRYSANTEIQIEIDSIVKPKAISVCTRYVDHLNYKKIRRENSERRDWRLSPNNADWIRKYQHELTIAEIFKYTPRETDTLERVVFRKKMSYEKFEYNAPEAYNYFDVKKFLYLEYVCYQYTQINFTEGMSYSSLAVTPVSSGLIYQLVFNKTSMGTAQMLKIAIHSAKTYPYRSLMVIPVLRRNFNEEDGTAKYNAFVAYDVSLIAHNLPPPYETNCRDYLKSGLGSDTRCIQECMKTRVEKQVGKIPFSVIINESYESSNKQMVSYQDVSDAKIAENISKIEVHCSRHMCRQKPCYQLTTITTTTEKAFSDFMVTRIVPSDPSITISSNPALDLVEYLTYVLSTISTWTGISIMSLNPGRLLHRLLFRLDVRLSRSRMRVLSSDIATQINRKQIAETLTSLSLRLKEVESKCRCRQEAAGKNNLSQR